jgi:hypothetical protein
MTRSPDRGWRGALARWWAAIAPGRQGRGADDSARVDPHYGKGSPNESGGDQGVAPEQSTHTGLPRDRGSREPLGPLTPDPGRPLGDTAEAHEELSPRDLPAGPPGRPEAERLADDEPGGTTAGNR